MRWTQVRSLLESDYTKLTLIMGLAFYIAFIPHLNYPYPVHVDEWVHLAYAQAMSQAGSTTFIEPFFGSSMISLSVNLEAGFHVLLSVFQGISGISWLTIFRYFPSIIFMITVLSVYLLARKRGFGWEAAFLTSLLPTTVGILGPAFLVPASMGLLFTPIIFFLATRVRFIWSYILIFLFISFLLSLHAPSAIYPVIVVAPYILMSLKDNLKHSLMTGLALLLPFLVLFPWIIDLLWPTALSLLSEQGLSEYVQIPRMIELYGYLPIALCLLGVAVLAIRRGRENYSLVLGLLGLLLVLTAFYSFGRGVPIMYERGFMYAMLMMSVVGGAGLMWVRKLKLPEKIGLRFRVPLVTRNIGVILCVIIVGLTLATVIPERQENPYYHMIDSVDYEAFVWISENIDVRYERAVLDPWKATAFTAITGKYVYTRIHMAPLAKDKEAYDFLKAGCEDTDFLEQHGISIVYSRLPCDNPDLTEVRENVYLLKETAGQ